jgi:uncharacterized membrane protein
MEPTPVRALRTGGRGGYLLVRAQEWERDRFWVLPSLLVLAGVVLAVLTAEAERLGIPTSWPSGLRVDPSTAGDILGVVAASMLTFVGVVFTLTLVALQLASAQLSPRVIRTFVRSGVTKAAFGIFLATFAYAMVAQVLEGARDNEPAQSRAVTMALVLVLVLASLVVFVVYVTATMKLLQVSWVITAVANETRKAVAANYPAADGYLQTNPPRLSADPRVVRLAARDGRGYKGSLGVVLGVDRARLVDLARRRGCVLELVARVGEYVPTGGAVFAVHGPVPPFDDKLLACVHLGRARTLYQDPSFGLRQLVDVAIQALSPALNQPTTAVQVIDRLQDILLRISRRPEPTGLFADDSGAVRLIQQVPTFDGLLDLAFTEITADGADSPQVARRLLAAHDELGTAVPERFRPGLAERRTMLVARIQEVTGKAIGSVALRPDNTGLG